MLLAPPIPVAGLDGGAEGGPDGGPEAGAGCEAAPSTAGSGIVAGDWLREGCKDVILGVDMFEGADGTEGLGEDVGGVTVIAAGSGGTGGVADNDGGNPPAALTDLEGGPLGGGCAALTAGVASGSFLLTHLFCSES